MTSRYFPFGEDKSRTSLIILAMAALACS